MGNQNDVRIARAGTFPDQAGEYLYKNGPTSERDLFDALASVIRAGYAQHALQGAIQGGWVLVTRAGLIDCTPTAKAHYDHIAGKVVTRPMGQIAPPRERVNAYERPPLSKKYLLNSRGPRQDVPDWSVRPVGFGFKSVSGGDAVPMRFPEKEGQ